MPIWNWTWLLTVELNGHLERFTSVLSPPPPSIGFDKGLSLRGEILYPIKKDAHELVFIWTGTKSQLRTLSHFTQRTAYAKSAKEMISYYPQGVAKMNFMKSICYLCWRKREMVLFCFYYFCKLINSYPLLYRFILTDANKRWPYVVLKYWTRLAFTAGFICGGASLHVGKIQEKGVSAGSNLVVCLYNSCKNHSKLFYGRANPWDGFCTAVTILWCAKCQMKWKDHHNITNGLLEETKMIQHV